MRYSIIFPCRDEELTIGKCIDDAKKAIPRAEIIVVNNSSKDSSAEIARTYGAKVVNEKNIGYGAALLKGFSIATGDYIIMCDADGTYNLSETSKMTKYSEYDMVIGNRLNERMEMGAMPYLHRFIGNPFLSALMRYMFHNKVKDTQSGFRIIKKSSLKKLDLQSTGMEIASEMLIKASNNGMKIKEIDISYHKRLGKSKLKSFNDGWKHLKMMLLYSPNHLFLIPGMFFFALGMAILAVIYSGPINIYGLKLDTHPAIIGSLFAILGYQILMLWLYAKTYTVNILGEKDKVVNWISNNISLERAMTTGLLLLLIGGIIGFFIIYEWFNSHFGRLFELRRAIFAMTLLILGLQTIFSGFLLSIMGTKRSSKY